MNLVVVGGSLPVISRSQNERPEWEHLRLERDFGCRTVDINRLRSPRSFVSRKLDMRLLLRLSRSLEDATHIVAMSEESGWDVALSLTMSNNSTPLFIIFHGQNWWAKRNRIFALIIKFKISIHFLCLSSSISRILIEDYGIPCKRVHITGFGVDERFFSPELTSNEALIVSAGTASRDYRTLIEAVLPLSIRVRIASDSTWSPEALDIGDVPSNVEVGTAFDYSGLRKLYERASFVVVPLTDANYACGYAVIAEAMAMGKAVIATKTRCPSDLIIDGVNGIYVPPGDPRALRQAICTLMYNPELAKSIGAAARETVINNFTLDSYVSRLIEAVADHG